MATRITDDASDEIIDNKCSFCAGKNITREAETYCIECREYYCIICTYMHKTFPALRSHKLLDKSDFWTLTSLPSYPTERCSIHKAKLLDMFCEDDNEVVCTTCVLDNHSSCQTIHSIPDEVDTLYKQPVSDQIRKDLLEEKQQFSDIKQRKEHILSDLKKKKKEAIDSVLDYKRLLEGELRRLERESINQIEKEYGRIERNIKDAIDESNAYIENFKQSDDKIQKSLGNKAQEFVSIKTAQKIIRRARKTKEILKSATVRKIVPKLNIKILHTLTHTKVLAYLPQTESRTPAYTVKENSCFSAKMGSDSSTCRLYSSCILEDGSLLVTDINNKKLKRIDTSIYTITDHLILENGPIAVRQTGKQEVAVSLRNKSVALVSLGVKMTVTRKLKMDHNCSGLAYKDDKLFISDENSAVYIHDINGLLIHKTTTDQTGHQMFKRASHVVPSSCSDFVYVCDSEKGLITLDMQGNYVSTFVDDEMISPIGVCTDSRGSIFVCSYASSNIIQIREVSMTKISVIKTDPYPLSVCFDQKQNKLFVTHNGLNSVNAYELQ